MFLTFSVFKVVLNGMYGLSTSQEKNVRKQLFAHFPNHLLSSAPGLHTRTAIGIESQGEFMDNILYGSFPTNTVKYENSFRPPFGPQVNVARELGVLTPTLNQG